MRYDLTLNEVELTLTPASLSIYFFFLHIYQGPQGADGQLGKKVWSSSPSFVCSLRFIHILCKRDLYTLICIPAHLDMLTSAVQKALC